MSDRALANAYAIVRQRAAALEWLTEGDEWDFAEDEDSDGGDADSGEGDGLEDDAEEEDSGELQGANRPT
ncbi:MAG: hypothetical protein AMXMBFR34_35280 [Myxococcaceae bacterium]